MNTPSTVDKTKIEDKGRTFRLVDTRAGFTCEGCMFARETPDSVNKLCGTYECVVAGQPYQWIEDKGEAHGT
jgi:hypothetical protein